MPGGKACQQLKWGNVVVRTGFFELSEKLFGGLYIGKLPDLVPHFLIDIPTDQIQGAVKVVFILRKFCEVNLCVWHSHEAGFNNPHQSLKALGAGFLNLVPYVHFNAAVLAAPGFVVIAGHGETFAKACRSQPAA